MRKIGKKNNRYIDCDDAELICDNCIDKCEPIFLDDALAPLIPILWEKGYITTFSCSGHISPYQDSNSIRGDTYIAFNANLCNCNEIINKARSLYGLRPTINISLYDSKINTLDLRFDHTNSYDTWLRILDGIHNFVYSINPNNQKDTKNEKEMIDSISSENMMYLYYGFNGSGFEKLINDKDNPGYSTLSKQGNPTYKGLPISKEEFTYDKFYYEIHNHNEHEFVSN